MVDLIIIPGKLSDREQGEKESSFFKVEFWSSADVLMQGLLVPAWSQLPVI